MVPWIVLLCLLALAGSMRWYRIDRESLAIDEYWALYLATGRGGQIFDLPYNKIISSPPAVGFDSAPPWWKIWTSIGSVTHPPLYYLSLRWWVDLFGPEDRFTRLLSIFFSMGSVVLIFDLVRRIAGPARGLIAAGLLVFAPAQIDFSQIDRPYTMLIFLSLGLCDAVIAIDRKSASRGKLFAVGLMTLLLAMTHYFSLGVIAAAGCYACWRFRGRARFATVSAIAIGLLLALMIWGPTLWRTHGVFTAYKDFAADPNPSLIEHIRAILAAPILFCLDPNIRWDWVTFVPLAVLVYLVPLFLIRKSPQLLLLWFWAGVTIALLVVADFLHHSIMIATLRYVFLMSPAVYALIAVTIPGRAGAAVAALILCCTAVYGASRIQVGPEPNEDWKSMARLIRHYAQPKDVVCLVGYYDTEPPFDYFVIAHYGGEWNCPVLFITSPPASELRQELAHRPRVWMVGHAVIHETRRLMPGWSPGEGAGIGRRNFVWALIPPSKIHAQ
jgi:hypothetical protein